MGSDGARLGASGTYFAVTGVFTAKCQEEEEHAAENWWRKRASPSATAMAEDSGKFHGNESKDRCPIGRLLRCTTSS